MDHLLPTYPTNPDSGLTEDAFENRQIREIDFEKEPLKIGQFNAVDWFRDGSLYLLDSPGVSGTLICILMLP